MARRRYVRDNRGRFASTGATSRGGRLKTASGKKRESQTIKAQSQQRSGTLTPGKKKPSVSAAPASSVRATGRLNRPLVSNAVKGTAGRLGPKNAIKAGPKSPKTKIDRAIKDIKSSNNDLGNKLKDARKRVDAFKGKMIKADKSRAQKAFDKPSVTDKRSRDFLGKLTKEGKKQDPATGGKKKLKPQQVRDLQSKSRQLKASASRNSARMGNTGSSPAQQAKLAKAAAADRKAAAAIDKKLKGQAAPPNVMAKSARLGGEGIGGRYKGKGKTSLYGKDLSKTKAARPSGTIGKPKGLKPQDSSKLKKGIAYNRMRAVNAKIANRPDIAQQHISGRFRGQAAKRMDASIDRAVKEVKAAKMAQLMKPKAQVKAERAARAEAKRAAALAKPKRVRSAESLRMSRAKRVLKEREMKTSGTLKQWEQSKRTQERALAFYKSNKRRRR